jgi:hypothetical protein
MLPGMGTETYQKRQKALARQQKQRDKLARRLQRRAEKSKSEAPLAPADSNAGTKVEPQSGN